MDQTGAVSLAAAAGEICAQRKRKREKDSSKVRVQAIYRCTFIDCEYSTRSKSCFVHHQTRSHVHCYLSQGLKPISGSTPAGCTMGKCLIATSDSK